MSNNPFANHPQSNATPEKGGAYVGDRNPYVSPVTGPVSGVPDYTNQSIQNKPAWLTFILVVCLVFGILGAITNLFGGAVFVYQYFQIVDSPVELMEDPVEPEKRESIQNLCIAIISLLVSILMAVAAIFALNRRGRGFLKSLVGVAIVLVFFRTIFRVYSVLTNYAGNLDAFKTNLKNDPSATDEMIEASVSIFSGVMIGSMIFMGVIAFLMLVFYVLAFVRLGSEEIVYYFENKQDSRRKPY